jgi:surfactin synthase thioesterase subunit
MTSRWIDGNHGEEDIRLFCFAHAGGGSSFFRPWKPLAPRIAVVPVVLPGREARWREPAYTKMDLLIEALFDAIAPQLDRPFALFGHSLGAIIAYELARRLADSGVGPPLCLFVSARRMPFLPARRPPIYNLPDDQLLAHIEQLNGTSFNLLREPSLLSALLPCLRADFELNDSYSPSPGRPLSIPISAFVGDRDPLVGIGEMRRWSELTAGEFSLRLFDGGHFYLACGPPDVLDAVREDVMRAAYLTASAP